MKPGLPADKGVAALSRVSIENTGFSATTPIGRVVHRWVNFFSAERKNTLYFTTIEQILYN